MLPIKFYETLEAVLYVAIHSGGRAVSSNEICHYQQVPARHLEQVMQMLVRQHILKGVTGPKGGYTLAREKRKMTLAEIWELFCLNLPHYQTSTDIGKAIISQVKQPMEQTVMDCLRQVTLEDLCKQIYPDSLASTDKTDFII